MTLTSKISSTKLLKIFSGRENITTQVQYVKVLNRISGNIIEQESRFSLDSRVWLYFNINKLFINKRTKSAIAVKQLHPDRGIHWDKTFQNP